MPGRRTSPLTIGAAVCSIALGEVWVLIGTLRGASAALLPSPARYCEILSSSTDSAIIATDLNGTINPS